MRLRAVLQRLLNRSRYEWAGIPIPALVEPEAEIRQYSIPVPRPRPAEPPPSYLLPVSEPGLRLAAQDANGRWYAVELQGEWTGSLETEDGREVTLELRPNPNLIDPEQDARVLRSVKPVRPNFVVRGEFERSP